MGCGQLALSVAAQPVRSEGINRNEKDIEPVIFGTVLGNEWKRNKKRQKGE
jgi:hypothetical protein